MKRVRLILLGAFVAKVEDSLRQSQALDVYWQRPMTGEQLQAEMERMAQRTKQPEVLREVWAALDNDPLVIAECLARPVQTERLIRHWYTSDEQFHGELRQQQDARDSPLVQPGGRLPPSHDISYEDAMKYLKSYRRGERVG